MTIYVRDSGRMMNKLQCSRETVESLQSTVALAQSLLTELAVPDSLVIDGKLELWVEFPTPVKLIILVFRKFQNGWWLFVVHKRKPRKRDTYRSYFSVPVSVPVRNEVSALCIQAGLRASYLGFCLEGTKPHTTVSEAKISLAAIRAGSSATEIW